MELVSGLGDGISVAQTQEGLHAVVDSDHEVVYTVDRKGKENEGHSKGRRDAEGRSGRSSSISLDYDFESDVALDRCKICHYFYFDYVDDNLFSFLHSFEGVDNLFFHIHLFSW